MNEPDSGKPEGPQGKGPQPPGRLGRPLMSWVIIIGLALLAMTLLSKGLGGRREITTVEF